MFHRSRYQMFDLGVSFLLTITLRGVITIYDMLHQLNISQVFSFEIIIPPPPLYASFLHLIPYVPYVALVKPKMFNLLLICIFNVILILVVKITHGLLQVTIVSYLYVHCHYCLLFAYCLLIWLDDYHTVLYHLSVCIVY